MLTRQPHLPSRDFILYGLGTLLHSPPAQPYRRFFFLPLRKRDELDRGVESDDKMAANRGRQRSHFQTSLLGVIQIVFSLVVVAIFILAFAAQGSLQIPQWGKSWQKATDAEIKAYTAALVPAVCILAGIFLIAGITLIRRERIASQPAIV
ncbi:hypothetical protein GGR52DRAFT_567445 [Hypoxylon sp. FL1284]|nr:hypothetical protein GGR52DRAFT_567445 [Hypoxylon sp. FL1284]